MVNPTLEIGDLLTINEAAELLRLRPSTMRNWILKKKIRYIKLSRRVFIRRSDLDLLIGASIVHPSFD
jgi:excisionase family DNA binding protein